MKPIELFYLLSNVKDRDKFIEILRANRIKPCRSKTVNATLILDHSDTEKVYH